MVKDVQQAVPGYGSQVRRPLNRDVGIKESALKMSTWVTIDKLSTGKARRTALPLENPLFFVYNPSTATKRAENAQNTDTNGLYEKFSRIPEHFSQLLTLLAGKQPRFPTRGCNLRPTSCRLCTPPRPLHNFLVLSVGRS